MNGAITDNVLEGSYIGAPRRSGKPTDEPTGMLAVVTIGGEQHQRTVYERRIWNNMRASKHVAWFVTVGGTNYELSL